MCWKGRQASTRISEAPLVAPEVAGLGGRGTGPLPPHQTGVWELGRGRFLQSVFSLCSDSAWGARGWGVGRSSSSLLPESWMRRVYRGLEQADCFSSIVMNPARSPHCWNHRRRCGPHSSAVRSAPFKRTASTRARGPAPHPPPRRGGNERRATRLGAEGRWAGGAVGGGARTQLNSPAPQCGSRSRPGSVPE